MQKIGAFLETDIGETRSQFGPQKTAKR